MAAHAYYQRLIQKACGRESPILTLPQKKNQNSALSVSAPKTSPSSIKTEIAKWLHTHCTDSFKRQAEDNRSRESHPSPGFSMLFSRGHGSTQLELPSKKFRFFRLLVRNEIPRVFLFYKMVWNGIPIIFIFRGMVRNEITKFRVFFSSAK
jgi:hypothetical protein